MRGIFGGISGTRRGIYRVQEAFRTACARARSVTSTARREPLARARRAAPAAGAAGRLWHSDRARCSASPRRACCWASPRCAAAPLQLLLLLLPATLAGAAEVGSCMVLHAAARWVREVACVSACAVILRMWRRVMITCMFYLLKLTRLAAAGVVRDGRWGHGQGAGDRNVVHELRPGTVH